MREIKFRAWDKANKEMLDIEDLHWDDCTREFLIRTTMYSDYFDTEDMILMQYTGLKDKNGKEIYEGDILPFTMIDGKTENYYIVFRDGEFEAINKKDTNFIWRSAWKESAVIGDIYNNPKLLEKGE